MKEFVCQNNSSGTGSPFMVTVCLGKFIKEETPPIYGNRCRFERKRKDCPYKAGLNRLKWYKSSNLLL